MLKRRSGDRSDCGLSGPVMGPAARTPTRSLPRACRQDSVTRRRHRLIAFAPTAAAVWRRRPRIEVGDGDVVAGIIRDDLAPKAAVTPVGYSSSGVCSVPYGPDRVATFAKRSSS